MGYQEYFRKNEYTFNNIIVLVYAVVLYMYSQYSALTGLYLINDDWPQHLLWLHKYQTNYFQNNDFYLLASEAIQPWGVSSVNKIASFFFSGLTISKFFPFFLLLATCWFTFFLIRKRFGWSLALAAMLMMSNIPLERMIGFFARAYAFPLLLGFLYFWVNENKKGILAIVMASSLFYPIIFLVTCGIIGLHYLKLTLKGELFPHYKKHLALLSTILLCGLLLFLKAYNLANNELIGDFFSKQALLSMPEFGKGGRVDFSSNIDLWMPINFPWQHYLRFPFSAYNRHIMIFFLACLVINRLRGNVKNKKFDESLLYLFISGTALFYLAIWQLPRLFLPERYLYYIYLPFLFLLVIRAFSIFKERFISSMKNSFLKYSLEGIILFLLVFSTFHIRSPLNAGLIDYGNHKGLYEKINTYKKPLLFAGPPNIMSQIPTFCRQSVLFSAESVHAIYFKHYYRYVKPRVEDFVQAYTTTEVGDLINFIKKYEINYLIVDKRFIETKNIWFYEPYNTMIKENMSKISPKELALNQLPEHFFEAADWQYTLLNCEKLLNENLYLGTGK